MNHNEDNLLEELEYIHRTIGKAIHALRTLGSVRRSDSVLIGQSSPPRERWSRTPNPKRSVEEKLARAQKGTLISRVERFLTENPSKKFDCPMIAEGIGAGNSSGISSIVSKLIVDGKVRRVAPGVFQGIAPHDEEATQQAS